MIKAARELNCTMSATVVALSAESQEKKEERRKKRGAAAVRFEAAL
jgi:hypothetical protein